MSQFQSHIDKFHAMTDASSILCLNTWCSFHQATEWLEGLARSVPNDKDELAKDQEIWVEAFSKAMVSQLYSMIAAADAKFGEDAWERHQCEADKLGIDTNIDNQFAVVVMEAKRAQAKWVGRAAMRLVSQVLVMRWSKWWYPPWR